MVNIVRAVVVVGKYSDVIDYATIFTKEGLEFTFNRCENSFDDTESMDVSFNTHQIVTASSVLTEVTVSFQFSDESKEYLDALNDLFDSPKIYQGPLNIEVQFKYGLPSFD